MRTLIAILAAALFLAGCIAPQQTPPGPLPVPHQPPASNQSNSSPAPNSTALAITQGPSFVCNLFDSRAKALGIGGADLGVPLLNGSSLWLIFGDTSAEPATSMKGPSGVVGSSSAIQSALPFDCSGFSWVESGSKFFQPLHSSRTPGMDESTVPAGGIVANGTAYIYAMRITHWSKNSSDPTHGYGVLFMQERQGGFKEVADWPLDEPFVNAAPAMGRLPDGTDAVFLAVSGSYRKSPVYLAYVLPEDIGNTSRYHYLSGYASDGSPVWSSDEAAAKPLIDGVWAGELSLEYDQPLGKYLLLFFDHRAHKLDLYDSTTPYGPFSGPAVSNPCQGASWMQPGWGGCYGGYILPDNFGPDGHDLYYTLSVWDPYATMLMKERLD